MSMMPSEVPSLIIPVEKGNLLVPNACVAEIVPSASSSLEGLSQPWIVGNFVWRDLNLPCLSFDKLTDNIDGAPGQSNRIAVFNTISDTFSMRFYGIAIYGIPRLARIVEQEIVEDDIEINAYEKLNVQVNGEACAIPDLEAIEKLLAASDLS